MILKQRQLIQQCVEIKRLQNSIGDHLLTLLVELPKNAIVLLMITNALTSNGILIVLLIIIVNAQWVLKCILEQKFKVQHGQLIQITRG